jgi:hypothetical protein
VQPGRRIIKAQASVTTGLDQKEARSSLVAQDHKSPWGDKLFVLGSLTIA